MKEFKIRCSSIAEIMTNDRSGKAMGKTSQSYCEVWLKEQLYERRKTFYSKYCEKGTQAEDASIQFIAEQLNLGFVLKNEQYYYNKYMHGIPDIVLPEFVIEVKNCWDCFTFPLFSDAPEKSHWEQTQGYMELTGKDKAIICYVLSDMPEDLIQKEIWNEARRMGLLELEPEMEADIREQFLYSKCEPKLRLKTFEITKDADFIASIYSRVTECRQYLQTLKF